MNEVAQKFLENVAKSLALVNKSIDLRINLDHSSILQEGMFIVSIESSNIAKYEFKFSESNIVLDIIQFCPSVYDVHFCFVFFN